jgi:uncharacterized protein YqeY
MPLKTRILDDIKQAMRSGDKPRLRTLRMVTSAVKQREVDERIEVDDAGVLAILEKMIKQRRESAEQYRSGGRPELAEAEEAEIAVLSSYLPEPMSAAQVDELIAEVIAETGASDLGGMGAVMDQIKDRAQGRVDLRDVAAKVRNRLGA